MEIRELNTSLASDDMSKFVFRLMNEKFGIQDHMHNYKRVMDVLKEKTGQNDSVFFGMYNDEDELIGVFGATDIVDGHSGKFWMLVWNKDCVCLSAMKYIKNFLDCLAGIHDLRRIEAQTPCDKLVRILKALRFKVEGRFKNGYRWQGKFYTLYQLRKLKEV